ncbi:MAG TPA: hypothetical protein VGF59_18040 [Bryobacteraceae bacterium]|jgi:hypothetical protein
MSHEIPRPTVPSGHLEASTVFRFLVEDFASVWDALVAGSEPPESGANFALGLMAGVLLELCCRIAGSNPHHYAQFSERLGQQEPRYYSEVPFVTELPKRFKLPAGPKVPANRQLLPVIFDLLRHGQAHQYQQMVARLADAKVFGIQLTGAERRQESPSYESLMRPPRARPADHLAIDCTVAPGNVWLRVHPEVLFKDIELAARMSSLLSGVLQLDYLRPPAFEATSEEILKALESAGHPKLTSRSQSA